MKVKHPNLIASLVSVLLTIALIYYMVIIRDPLGLIRNIQQRHLMHSHIIDHPTGYTYEAGRYEGAVHTVIMLHDGLRFVPDSVVTSDCTIVFVGDSLTYGEGVADEATFANLAARDYGYNVLNAGRNGYNAAQVAEQIEYYDADGYVWLIIGNDHQATRTFTRPTSPPRSGIELYHWWVTGMLTNNPYREQITPDMDLFNRALEDILPRDDVLAWTYGETFRDELPSDTLRLTGYPSDMHINPTDPHPNADGHVYLWHQLAPHYSEFVNEICN